MVITDCTAQEWVEKPLCHIADRGISLSVGTNRSSSVGALSGAKFGWQVGGCPDFKLIGLLAMRLVGIGHTAVPVQPQRSN